MANVISRLPSGGIDVSDTTATASRVIAPDVFYDKNGARGVGTLQSVNGGDIYFNVLSVGDDDVGIEPPDPIAITNPSIDGVWLDSKQLASVAGLTSAKLAAGNTVLGIIGKSTVVDTADATADESKILAGSTAYVNGAKKSGNIPVIGDNWQMATPIGAGSGYLLYNPPKGYYYGGGDCRVGSYEPDLVPANVLSGKTICGMQGTATQGKKYATGTVSASTGSTTISYWWNGTQTSNTSNYFTISGLGFTPRIILYKSGTYSLGDFVVQNGNSPNVYHTQTAVAVGSGYFTLPYLGTGTWEAYE